MNKLFHSLILVFIFIACRTSKNSSSIRLWTEAERSSLLKDLERTHNEVLGEIKNLTIDYRNFKEDSSLVPITSDVIVPGLQY